MKTLLLSLVLQVASGFILQPPQAAGRRQRRSDELVSLAESADGVEGKINSLIDLDSPKVVNNESIDCGKKGVYCRCWKSATFPACDGSHMKHNEATGDNVGPLIVSACAPESSSNNNNKDSVSLGLASLWGAGGVLVILLEAFRRTLPSALEPIRAGNSFSPVQWLAYSAAVVVFTYGQGQKCLSCKLAPLVVKRSSLLTAKSGGQRSIINVLLAPVYAMGLIAANKKRLIISHSLVWGTATLQVALQRGWVLGGGGPILNIVNGGFCAGFAWGALSLAWQYGKALCSGKVPSIDAGLA